LRWPAPSAPKDERPVIDGRDVRPIVAAALAAVAAFVQPGAETHTASSVASIAPATSTPALPRTVPGGRRQGFGPGPQVELKVVDQFDRNRNGRLDQTERQAAREWLSTQGYGWGGRGGRRGFAGPPPAGRALRPSDVRAYTSEPLYDLATLRTIFLEFEQTDWEAELAAFYNTDVEVPAKVTVDGGVYPDVGVHFRGNSSYRMVPEGYKRSLNLSFDFVKGDQEIGGYRTLNLLNANGDPTFLRTVIYTEIARQYLPIPKTNFVRVAINGESWGVYVSAQQFNKDFLRDWFNTTSGARWKAPGSPRGRAGLTYLGSDVAAYRQLYEIKTKDDPASWAALINLCRVLNQTPADKLEAALAPILDVDAALKFLALDVALVNSDGYWTRASDYNLYLDPGGRFHVIPHDVNEGLGAEGPGRFGGGFGEGGTSLDPLVGLNDDSKPLRSKLLAVPALRTRYLGYMRDIATKGLDWNTLEPRVREWQALIAADVKADTKKLSSTERFQYGMTELRHFIETRREFLLKNSR
jgi:CotH protein